MNVYQGNETLVTKTTVTVPINGGPVEAVSTIETVPYWTRSRRKTGRFPFSPCDLDSASVLKHNQKWSHSSSRLSAAMEWDSESVQSEDVFKQPENPDREPRPMQPKTPQNQGGVRPHEFVSKTVREQWSRGGSELVFAPSLALSDPAADLLMY